MPNEPIGNQPPRQFTLRGLFVLMALVALLLGILLPGLRSARESARRNECQFNMKSIAIATLNYRDRNGTFPPAYVADRNGKPLSSWRVPTLPFLYSSAMASCYHFDEPWDSPGNLKDSTNGCEYFRCPSDPSVSFNGTNYVMIVGRGMFSEGALPIRPEAITDGESNTIMFTETTPGIPWSAPHDLEADKITFEINNPKTPGISSGHRGGANGAFCDGSIAFLSDSTAPEVVRAMCTRNGGEKINRPTPVEHIRPVPDRHK